MKFFKFIKNYTRAKKVINELEYRKGLAELKIEKIDKLLKKSGGTFAPYRRKKLEFYKGQVESYGNSILIIETFMDTGNLPEIIDEEDSKL